MVCPLSGGCHDGVPNGQHHSRSTVAIHQTLFTVDMPHPAVLTRVLYGKCKLLP